LRVSAAPTTRCRRSSTSSTRFPPRPPERSNAVLSPRRSTRSDVVTVAVVGAGAIGGLLGAYLSRSGEEVILVARGPHLAAMQSRGVTVRSGGAEFTARPECTDDMTAIGRADVVFLTLKAHSIPAVAETIGSSLAE